MTALLIGTIIALIFVSVFLFNKLMTCRQLLQESLDLLDSQAVVLQQNGTIVVANKAWKHFAVQPQDGLSGNSFNEAYKQALPGNAEDGKIIATGLSHVLNGQAPLFLHEYCQHERWFELKANQIRTNTGIHVFLRHTELTDQHRLAAEQRRLVRAVEASQNMIMIADCNGNLVYVNPAFSLHTGYTSQEAIGRNPSFLQAHDEHQTDYPKMWETLLSGETWHGIFCNRRKDGQILWESACISPVRNQKGEIEHFVAVKENISETRRMAEELDLYRQHLEEEVEVRTRAVQSTQAELKQILDSTSEGMIRLDLDASIQFVNPAASQILHCQAGDLLHKPVLQVICHTAQESEHTIQKWDQVTEAIKAGQRLCIEKITLGSCSGPHVALTVTIFPITDNGRIAGAVMSFSDITERVKFDQDREEARAGAEALAAAHFEVAQRAESVARMKNSFFANMSHELRTPLNGIIGLARIGERDCHEPDCQSIFQRINESGQLLLGIINDILDFSKIDAGKLTLESIAYDLPQVAKRIVRSVEPSASIKGIQIEVVSTLPAHGGCLGDPTRLSQILLNLLSNAVKFTESGKVTMRYGLLAEELVIQIEDTGIGIAPNDISRLFQAFEQVDSSTSRKYGGSGLGLAISRKLAEMMKGSLSVHSELGQGSIFELRLPYIQADLPNALLLPVPAEKNRLKGIRILVAEDNEINRLVLEDLLSSEGAEVTCVEDGQEAIDFVQSREQTVDLVLTDVQMPHVDGLEATRAIRKINPALPIIGQTAHVFREEHQRCFEAGMLDTVTKPINPEELIAKILRTAKLDNTHLSAAPPTSPLSYTLQPEQLPSTLTLIDWAELDKQYGYKDGMVRRLLQIALDSHSASPELLQAHIQNRDAHLLGGLAHKLKGGCATIFASQTSALAAEVSREIANHDPKAFDTAQALVDSLKLTLAAIQNRLHQIDA